MALARSNVEHHFASGVFCQLLGVWEALMQFLQKWMVDYSLAFLPTHEQQLLKKLRKMKFSVFACG